MRSDQREQRSPLGLGPLETAIMQVMWEAGDWLMVRDIRDRMDYPTVAYTTVAQVTRILSEKGLLIRRLGDREGKPGPSAWWYRASRSMNEHIGELIARLMDYSPDPEAALAYALAAHRKTRQNNPEETTSRRERPP
jgi:predicted transcriptional regulator